MEFIEPEPDKMEQSKEHWAAVVKELMSRPNEYALVGTYSPGVAAHMRAGRYKAFIIECGCSPKCDDPAALMAKHWLITTRAVAAPRRAQVFIKWLG